VSIPASGATDGAPAGEPPAPWREPPRGGTLNARISELDGIGQMRAMIAGEAPDPPLTRLTGMRLAEIGPGTATFTMPLTGWLRGPGEQIPIGPLTIPADAAMACAAISLLGPHTSISTSELALRQVRPAAVGDVVWARARVVEPGPPVALTEVSLTDGAGALIAHGTSLCLWIKVDPGQLPADGTGADGAGGGGGGADGGGADGGGADGTVGRPDPWRRDPPPHAGLAELVGLAADPAGPSPPGEASFILPASPWLCAPPPGRVQGGMVAVLADAAIAGAIAGAVTNPSGSAAREIKLNYLRPLGADGRTARARGRLVSAGRRIAVATADVLDADGRAIAVASGSVVAAHAWPPTTG
jgi:uncharacterized protein (TIGR00369 family)